MTLRIASTSELAFDTVAKVSSGTGRDYLFQYRHILCLCAAPAEESIQKISSTGDRLWLWVVLLNADEATESEVLMADPDC